MMLVATGGTISGEVGSIREGGSAFEAKVDKDVVARDAKSLQALLGGTLSYLKDHLKIQIDLVPMPLIDPETKEAVRIDSSDFSPRHWKLLIELIYNEYDTFDSFVITHGTNTLGYTCAALSFAIANSQKPIILTGSQVPTNIPGTDARTNLENAIRVAVWHKKAQTFHGVVAVFGSQIIGGTRVKKSTEFDYDTFKPHITGSLGRIGRIINVHEENLKLHNEMTKGQKRRASARTRAGLEVFLDDFETNIVSLTEFPGMSPRVITTLVDRLDVKGFILRAFGAGDPAATLRPAFEKLKDRDIPIVVTTQAPQGHANFEVNEPGMWLAEHRMAIPAHDMNIESQTAKLAWLLAKKRDGIITQTDLCEMMVTNLHGEINENLEVEL